MVPLETGINWNKIFAGRYWISMPGYKDDAENETEKSKFNFIFSMEKITF